MHARACVSALVSAVCAVSVVFEQHIQAAEIRGHPWHLTPFNHTSAEFYPPPPSLPLFLPFSHPFSSISSSSTHGESSQAVVHQGGQTEMKLCRKEKPRQWPWLEGWLNDQTSWQLYAFTHVYVCVCVAVGVKEAENSNLIKDQSHPRSLGSLHCWLCTSVCVCVRVCMCLPRECSWMPSAEFASTC